MKWGDTSLQIEGIRCGHLRSPARCDTEGGGFRILLSLVHATDRRVERKLTVGWLFFYQKSTLSTAQAKHKFYRKKKKRVSGIFIHGIVWTSRHRRVLGTLFFDPKKSMFHCLWPDRPRSDMSEISQDVKKCPAAFSANAFACKSRQ
jgi:hypothetical protein